MIYVWSTEQDSLSKRSLRPNTEASTENAASTSDMLVPWVSNTAASQSATGTTPEQRYYHFFSPGELGNLVREAAAGMGILGELQVVQEGWERSNDYIELKLQSSPQNIQ